MYIPQININGIIVVFILFFTGFCKKKVRKSVSKESSFFRKLKSITIHDKLLNEERNDFSNALLD